MLSHCPIGTIHLGIALNEDECLVIALYTSEYYTSVLLVTVPDFKFFNEVGALDFHGEDPSRFLKL